MKDPISIAVLIVEDDPANLEGMQVYLARQGFTIYTASTYADGLRLFEMHRPSATILDIMLVQYIDDEPHTHSGLTLARQLRRLDPQAGFIFRSAYTHFVPAILNFVKEGYGGVAYLYKGGGRPAELMKALHIVLNGGIYFDSHILAMGQSVAQMVLDALAPEEQTIVRALLPRIETLTSREREVLERLCWSRTAIGKALCISERTVDRHVNNLYRKLDFTQAQYPAVRQDVILAKTYLIYRLQVQHDQPD